MSGDPVSTAMIRIKREIPKEILNQAFLPKRYDPVRQELYRDNVSAANIEQLIRQVIVVGMVSVDVNLISGTELHLPLALAQRDWIDNWNIVYRFDDVALGGRKIIAAHEVLYGLTQGVQIGTYGAFDTRASQFMHIGKDILNAAGGTPPVGTAYVQILTPNSVLVNDINQVVGPGVLRCKLSHDPHFSDIKPYYHHHFTELVVLATKGYIYNELVIEIDEAQLKAAASIGRFREIVDSYADANQMYWEYLTTRWQKIGLMNDTEQMRKVGKLLLGAKPKY